MTIITQIGASGKASKVEVKTNKERWQPDEIEGPDIKSTKEVWEGEDESEADGAADTSEEAEDGTE